MIIILRCLFYLLIIWPAIAQDNTRVLEYNFQLNGLEVPSILKRFNAASSLITYKESPVFSIQNLHKRICDDYDRLVELLDAKGYYDAKVHVVRDEKSNPVQVSFNVETGARYKLKTIHIDLSIAYNDLLEAYPFLFEDLPIQVGNFVSAEKIHETFAILTEKLGHCGYPYATVSGHTVEMIEESKRIILHIEINPGKKMYFGDINVVGVTAVPAQYVINRAPWEKADVYDSRKVERYKEKLTKTRLFNTITIDHPEHEPTSELLPLNVVLGEGKSKTISGGLSYALNDGFGASLAWTHRNLTDNADRLRSTISYSQVKSKLDAEYEVPDFLWNKTTLSPSIAAAREDTESYVSKGLGATVMLRHEFDENCEYFYGGSIDFDQSKQNTIKKSGQLLGIPVGLKYDKRDDILDPSNGFVVNISFVPKIGRVGSSNFMTKTIVSGSIYHPVMPKVTLASWARAGTIAGISLNDVLANQRFYSGGGGSIRGFGYQMAGPYDQAYKPTGGKSLVEGGFEARIRILDDWGAAIFIEGGYVGRSTIPTFKEDVLFGAGVGVRYFTDFGPIRADFATPLNPRKKPDGKKIDGRLQFYISIGQGF